jgi:hypothetical protein
MRILFLTIGAVYNFSHSGAYTDLLKKFAKEGHKVYVVGALEKRNGRATELGIEEGINVLRVRVGNITKTNLIEKGISTLTLGYLYKKAIDKYWGQFSFDLILYTTPPITIAGLVSKLKKKYNAYTYLLLKDIFPQNAIDIGILSPKGWKGIVYRYFKYIERQLYSISDKIGCMSNANIDFILKNNKEIAKDKIELCPNTIDFVHESEIHRDDAILEKYKIPKDKYLLLYGGNFGKPQNVDYVIEAIDRCSDIEAVHFILCGSGTEFSKIDLYIKNANPKHVTIIDCLLPYEEYSCLVASCDVGLLFLDYRFTIPNFPSRLLDYMNYGLPVIAATDINTDVGRIIMEENFGWWVESKNPQEFRNLISSIFESKQIEDELQEKSRNARNCLKRNYVTDVAYSAIVRAYKKNS